MIPDQKKQYEEAAKAYVEREWLDTDEEDKTKRWASHQVMIMDFLAGCEYAHEKVEKEAHNKALDEAIKAINKTATPNGIAMFLIEELKKLRK